VAVLIAWASWLIPAELVGLLTRPVLG